MRLRRAFGIIALVVAAVILSAGPVMAQDPTQAPLAVWAQVLDFLSNPNVAYLLLVLGLLGIVAEVATGGSVFPGVAGAICLVLSMMGLLQLPTNWIGAVLIVAGIVMFVIDVKITGMVLSIGAVFSFALGSLMLYTPFWVDEAGPGVVRLNPWLALSVTGAVALFFLMGIAAAMRAHLLPSAMGIETITGKVGTVRSALAPEGIVHLEGEEWSAVSHDGGTLPAGSRVRVVGADGLKIVVELLLPPRGVRQDPASGGEG